MPSASDAKANSGYETSEKIQNGNQIIAIAINQIGIKAATGASALIAAESTCRLAFDTH
jgi:hypothetical protein